VSSDATLLALPTPHLLHGSALRVSGHIGAPGPTALTFLQFDLSELSVDPSHIAHATMWVYVRHVYRGGLFCVSPNNTIELSHLPDVSSEPLLRIWDDAQYTGVDVTAIVIGWLNGTLKNEGVWITPTMQYCLANVLLDGKAGTHVPYIDVTVQ
jgi:hypothetical protein